jgi:Asp-tRNA(Asn)/Glu-tRNA(Gln) amidotransferase A subunit family amidase
MNVDAFHRIDEMNVLEYRGLDSVRAEIFEAIQSYFEDFDLLILPTLTVPPFKHGASTPQSVNGESMTSTLEWALTWVFNLTGHPVSSVPAGFTDEGLPVGMQIVGPRFADERVLAASGAFERIQPWLASYPQRQ